MNIHSNSNQQFLLSASKLNVCVLTKNRGTSFGGQKVSLSDYCRRAHAKSTMNANFKMDLIRYNNNWAQSNQRFEIKKVEIIRTEGFSATNETPSSEQQKATDPDNELNTQPKTEPVASTDSEKNFKGTTISPERTGSSELGEVGHYQGDREEERAGKWEALKALYKNPASGDDSGNVSDASSVSSHTEEKETVTRAETSKPALKGLAGLSGLAEFYKNVDSDDDSSGVSDLSYESDSSTDSVSDSGLEKAGKMLKELTGINPGLTDGYDLIPALGSTRPTHG